MSALRPPTRRVVRFAVAVAAVAAALAPIACATSGTAPPAQGPTGGSAGRDGAIYDRAIRDHQASIKSCYDSYLSRGAPSGANLRVTVRIVILADGAVDSATVLPAPQFEPRLDTCIATAVRSWILPKPPSANRITLDYPFNFVGERRGIGGMPSNPTPTLTPLDQRPK